MDHKELKKKAKNLEPVVRVGKAGISESLISEIKKHLKKKKLIKIKFLRSAVFQKSVKEQGTDIAEKTESELVVVTGFTAVFWFGKRK
ncbi:MAG: YhbY family RNA-binding protein [Nanoarchaeota archaeon]